MRTNISTYREGKKGRTKHQYAWIAVASLLLAGTYTISMGQDVARLQPTWLWGISGAANFNIYRGTSQKINATFTAPTAFENGFGIGGYGSALIEYRHNSLWGITFDAGFDNRYGILHYGKTFIAPGDLTTNLNYITIDPSFRIAPWKSPLYFFLGPTVGFNIQKSYSFTEKGNGSITSNGNWGYMNDPVLSGQVGVGYEIRLSSATNQRYAELSPFIAYLPYFSDNQIRTIEKLTLHTIRAGIVLKFGCIPKPVPIAAIPPPEKEVAFNVRVPSCIRMQRMIKETLPLRNYIFFDKGSSSIPDRYVKLSPGDAAKFNENQMQNTQSSNPKERSSRQLAVYYNILNILGDRMRNNPSATIKLIGSSGGEGADKGKALAQSVKNYLIKVFGIDSSRISIEGRDRPLISSRMLLTTQQFDLVDAEDRRVDIVSSSPQLEMPYGDSSGMLKPAQLTYTNPDLLDNSVIFSAPGAQESLTSWSVAITDEKGNVQHYGPYTSEEEVISGKKILGNNQLGIFKVVITGITKSGKTIVKESPLDLICSDQPAPTALRYSILFEFDKSKTSDTYASFLTKVVAPAIKSGSTVIIHGHTDIVGPEDYNLNLSKQRAEEARVILEKALQEEGKSNVTFQILWFGENTAQAPFDNQYPEERFYNRTVVIDIMPGTSEKTPTK